MSDESRGIVEVSASQQAEDEARARLFWKARFVDPGIGPPVIAATRGASFHELADAYRAAIIANDRDERDSNHVTEAVPDLGNSITGDRLDRYRDLEQAARLALSHGDKDYCWSCGERWWVSASMGACKLHWLYAALQSLGNVPNVTDESPSGLESAPKAHQSARRDADVAATESPVISAEEGRGV